LLPEQETPLDKDISEPMSEFHQIEYGADFDLEGSVDHGVGQEGDSLHMDYDRRALMYAQTPQAQLHFRPRDVCRRPSVHYFYHSLPASLSKKKGI
jgi:hypothetical protein